MKKLLGVAMAGALGLAASQAQAAGELYFYNWTDYTAPKMIAKFEKETGIKVTVDTYDSNETLLAKLKSGATGCLNPGSFKRSFAISTAVNICS